MGFSRRVPAGAALLCVALAVTGCAPADPRGERTAALLDDALGEEEGPGCSAAVAEKGEVIWTYVHGLADVEKGTPIDTSTRFNIGSVSKQFTATAALMLAEQGVLALDDAVADFVDGLGPWAEEVTVADLMMHTSGIVDLTIGDRDDPVDLENRLRALGSDQAHRSDTAFHYSNDNYVLLGLVVEAAGGGSFDEWMQEHVFTPYDLDMTVDPGADGDDVAIGYRESWEPFTPALNTYFVPGPTGIIASPSELARWGDHYREPVTLPSDALLGALDAAVALTGSDAGWHYGPGIFTFEDGRIEHGGFDAGVSTHFAISPDRGTTLAISCTRQISQTDLNGDMLHAIWFGGEASPHPE